MTSFLARHSAAALLLAWSAFLCRGADPPDQPKVRHFIGFEYPWFARRAYLQAEISLKGNVSSTGKLEDIVITSNSPAFLSVGVVKVLAEWQFDPCTSTNKAGCEYDLKVSFRLLPGYCDPSREYCPSQVEFHLPNEVIVKAKPLVAAVN